MTITIHLSPEDAAQTDHGSEPIEWRFSRSDYEKNMDGIRKQAARECLEEIKFGLSQVPEAHAKGVCGWSDQQWTQEMAHHWITTFGQGAMFNISKRFGL